MCSRSKGFFPLLLFLGVGFFKPMILLFCFIDCDLVSLLLQDGVFKIYKVFSPPTYFGWGFFLSLWSLFCFNNFNNNGVSRSKGFFYAYVLLRVFKIYIAQDCCTQDSNVSISSSRLVHLNGILPTCSELSTINSHALRSLFAECFMNM